MQSVVQCERVYRRCDFCSEVGRYGVPYLHELLGSVSLKVLVIGKSLQSRGFPDRKTPALRWIGVNEVMSVLRDVGNDCGGRQVTLLHMKPVFERCTVVRALRVCMVRQQTGREVSEIRRVSSDAGEAGGKEVSMQILSHVRSGVMARDAMN